MAYATGMTLSSRSILPTCSRTFLSSFRIASLLVYPEKSSSIFFRRVQVPHLYSTSTSSLFSSVKCSIQSTSSHETDTLAVSRPNVVDILEERGLLESVTSENLRSACSDPNVAPLKVYCGFDPTAESLHLGNLLGIIVLSWFQRCGHQAVGLIGGATGRVGDPSGKSLERPELDADTLEKNIEGIKTIIIKILGGNPSTELDWNLIEKIAEDIPSCSLPIDRVSGLSIVDLSVSAGLFESKSAARRMLKQDGFYMNNERVDNENQRVEEEDIVEGKGIVLSAGKKNKVVVRIS